LGNVIAALTDAKSRPHIPYRDSALTRMLQEALGGNSSTIMVCAIRPGHMYYEETCNTLKYADRAKKIKNKPTINESPQDKLIRELMEENKKLKEQLANGGGGGSGDPNDPQAATKLKEAEEELRRIWQGSWAGKSEGDPFIVRGGYRCRHTWLPVVEI